MGAFVGKEWSRGNFQASMPESQTLSSSGPRYWNRGRLPMPEPVDTATGVPLNAFADSGTFNFSAQAVLGPPLSGLAGLSGLLDGCTNPDDVSKYVGAIKVDAQLKGIGLGVLVGVVGLLLAQKYLK